MNNICCLTNRIHSTLTSNFEHEQSDSSFYAIFNLDLFQIPQVERKQNCSDLRGELTSNVNVEHIISIEQ